MFNLHSSRALVFYTEKEATSGEKPAPMLTHPHNMIILLEMTGSQIAVYNGKNSQPA
jgi:ribosomal protein S19